jgi:hypothetical protein
MTHETEKPVRNAPDAGANDVLLRRSLVWAGVVGVSAAAAFLIVRAVMARRPVDPTTERIQSLIDEANRLLRTLDDPSKH